MKFKQFIPLIGILLFVYILIRLNVLTILEEILSADGILLFFACIGTIFFLLVQTFKWFVIARVQKIPIGFLESFNINLMSNFYGFITPSKVGTIVRAEYLKKYSNGMLGKGVCNFTLDKVLDITSILFIGIISLFIFQSNNIPVLSLWYLITPFFLLVFLTLLFIKKERSYPLLRVVYRFLVPESMKESAKVTFESFYEHIPRKRYFPLFFLLNIINWLVMYGIIILIGFSLGITLPIVYFFAILPIGTLVALIPITVNGLGTREAVLISLFGLFSISAAKVVSMSLIHIMITAVLPAFIGWLLILTQRPRK